MWHSFASSSAAKSTSESESEDPSLKKSQFLINLGMFCSLINSYKDENFLIKQSKKAYLKGWKRRSTSCRNNLSTAKVSTLSLDVALSSWWHGTGTCNFGLFDLGIGVDVLRLFMPSLKVPAAFRESDCFLCFFIRALPMSFGLLQLPADVVWDPWASAVASKELPTAAPKKNDSLLNTSVLY